MPASLHQHALAGIDQDDRQLRARGAGRHVAGILLMARCVGDDERALRGVEISVGNVDRDALLALGFKAVNEEREIDVVTGRAMPRGILDQARQLILEDKLRICSIRPISVDLPSSTEPQVMKRSRFLVGPLRRDRLANIVSHQK